MGEIEKLKAMAVNIHRRSWERVKAQEALLEVGTKEAMLALLDIASIETLYEWERDSALTKARKLIKEQK
ncbi:unnamed protein product [marine sediment metagenome]|uniref:Uncharacterized protein n=1 Tax=marine sediment metagenome TaxID=412755 RepID=X1KUL1_9ZZZZ